MSKKRPTNRIDRFWATIERHWDSYKDLLEDSHKWVLIRQIRDGKGYIPCDDGLLIGIRYLEDYDKVPGHVKGYLKRAFKKFYPTTYKRMKREGEIDW